MNTTPTVSARRPIAALCAPVLVAALTVPDATGAGLLKPVGGRDAGAHIKSHHVEVVLNNGFAQVVVDQVFGNDSDADFEACYSFPIPKSASLSELSLWIGGKEVLGEVVEKEKARQIYDKQRQQGKDTALAEKNDFKTFDIRVGVVRAGEDTRVRLVYYQPLEIDLNVGRFVYPLAEGGVDDERIAFWETDDRVREAFSFKLSLKSAFPVKDVRLPGYDAVAQIAHATNETGVAYDVRIDSQEGGATLSRDIVFYYRLDESAPARVELIPYRAAPDQPGTFMAVITPAADLKRIAEGCDWIFVLDRSGSMSGGKIATLVDGVGKVLGKLSPADRFKIVSFNDGARDETGGFVAATPANVQQWTDRVRALQAEGGTALFDGLREAYRGLDDDRTTSVILVTDGCCNVGPTEHSTFLKLLRGYDLRLFTFVMGNSANQPLMERLAKDSGGFAMNVSDSDDVVGRLMQAKIHVLRECLHDVRLSFSGEKVVDLTPAAPGNLYAGQQLVAFGRYNGHGPVELKFFRQDLRPAAGVALHRRPPRDRSRQPRTRTPLGAGHHRGPHGDDPRGRSHRRPPGRSRPPRHRLLARHGLHLDGRDGRRDARERRPAAPQRAARQNRARGPAAARRRGGAEPPRRQRPDLQRPLLRHRLRPCRAPLRRPGRLDGPTQEAKIETGNWKIETGNWGIHLRGVGQPAPRRA